MALTDIAFIDEAKYDHRGGDALLPISTLTYVMLSMYVYYRSLSGLDKIYTLYTACEYVSHLMAW